MKLRTPAVLVGLATLLLPVVAEAQLGVVVEGRVTSEGGPAIQNAAVALLGRGSVLTGAGGGFRFEDVEPGEYTLQVEAFGYIAATYTIAVDQDLSITVDLDIAPFELDSLVIAPDQIDMSGQVRDVARDVSLRGADVRTNQGHDEVTNSRGRFEIEVWEGAPIMVRLRAFGYLPVDTLVMPERDSSFVFLLAADAFVERMIETEITRIEERAGGRRAITMPPLDRDDLVRWDGATLRDVLQWEYPTRGRRIRCVVVDEQALTPQTARGVLETTLARDVERIEFLFRGAMLRVYTREFMRTMLGSGIELRRPTYADMADPPLCT